MQQINIFPRNAQEIWRQGAIMCFDLRFGHF